MVRQLDANLQTTVLKLEVKTQQQQQQMELSEFCACERNMAVRWQEKRAKRFKSLHKRHSGLTLCGWSPGGTQGSGHDPTTPHLNSKAQPTSVCASKITSQHGLDSKKSMTQFL